jgi:hypothetical protein
MVLNYLILASVCGFNSLHGGFDSHHHLHPLHVIIPPIIIIIILNQRCASITLSLAAMRPYFFCYSFLLLG